MKAVVMAGGKGTRLGPYTALFPKPLMPLGDEMPVLELLLHQLRNAGVKEVILAVNHLEHLIRFLSERLEAFPRHDRLRSLRASYYASLGDRGRVLVAPA